MIKKFLFLVVSFVVVVNCKAQIGESSFTVSRLGTAVVGEDNNIGKSSLPVCTVNTSSCSLTPYIFIGNGNWNVETNWLGNLIPPTVLPSGKTITINPIEGGQCILNVPQTIADGAQLNIIPTKRFRIVRSLVLLE